MITTPRQPQPHAAPPADERAAGLVAPFCTRCIMDSSDPEIQFDDHGHCNHCRRFDRLYAQQVRTGEAGRAELERVARVIRERGRGKRYDCVMGVSGGVDSTYTAYLARELGLRPLAVHMDNGWDSELAVSNIEKVLKTLEIDLHTHVLDWEEFRDLQLAFLKASVPDGEIPTDHAIGAVVYQTAVKHGIDVLLSGSNIVTECILPSAWTYGILDWKYIRGVHRRFGTRPIRQFPHYSLPHMYYYTSVRRIRTVRPLNLVPYVKSDVIDVLQSKLGWKYYGGKHYESIYTRFFQGYVLPKKFGIDKRKAHLSTLICAGQVSRQQALEELHTDTYAGDLQEQDREYTIKKLGITEAGFAAIMAAPVKSHRDYPNSEALVQGAMRWIRRAQRWRLLPKGLEGPI